MGIVLDLSHNARFRLAQIHAKAGTCLSIGVSSQEKSQGVEEAGFRSREGFVAWMVEGVVEGIQNSKFKIQKNLEAAVAWVRPSLNQVVGR